MRKIGIFGPPRSGTSWLAHIFNSHPEVALRFQPLFSYSHKGALSPTSSAEEIDAFFDAILHTNDQFALMQAESQNAYPVFLKANQATHIIFKETRYLNVVRNILETSLDVQIFGIIRNPLATLASWMRAPKEFSPTWDIRAEWREALSKNQGRPEEFFGFDKWKEAAYDFLDFKKHYPDRFQLICYDKLNSEPEAVISDAFRFSGLSIPLQTDVFIRNSRSRQDEDPYSVYRVKVDDNQWKDILPSYIEKAVLEELKGTPLSIFI